MDQRNKSGLLKEQTQVLLVLEQTSGATHALMSMLESANYTLYSASQRATALRQLYACQPDLVLLDLDAVELDGWQLLQRVRELSDVPIIVTGSDQSEEAIVHALYTGAFDYLVKPVKPAILRARIHVAFRCVINTVPRTPFAYDDGYLQIDVSRHQVMVAGKAVKLSAIEYKLLLYLMQHANFVRTFGQILENVWGWEYRDSRDYVYTYIRYLRQKLELDPKNPRYIVTEHNAGYKFVRRLRNEQTHPGIRS